MTLETKKVRSRTLKAAFVLIDGRCFTRYSMRMVDSQSPATVAASSYDLRSVLRIVRMLLLSTVDDFKPGWTCKMNVLSR